jgi:hypothetical protein
MRDGTLFTNDDTNNPFEPSSADAISNGNENPTSINIEPTTIVIIVINVIIEGNFPDITQITIFSFY